MISNDTKTVWLSLNEIQAGLFPTECTVSLSTADGVIQIFVSRLQIDEQKKALKARVLDSDAAFFLVQLASQGGGRVAKVARSVVLSAA